MESIILDDITVSFGHTNVLDKMRLALPECGVLALVGPNGAGKSTLLDVISGFIRPSYGSVKLAQQRSNIPKLNLHRHFARLHQRLVVPPSLLVREYLCLAMQPELATSLRGLVDRSWCNTEAVEDILPTWLKYLLNSAGVWESLNVRVEKLSYGQQRIVALGAVLLSPKSGILLDEPMAGLSNATREVAMETIINHGKHRLVLIAEHDLDTVKKMADELVVIVGGRIVHRYSGTDVPKAELLGHFLTGNVT